MKKNHFILNHRKFAKKELVQNPTVILVQKFSSYFGPKVLELFWFCQKMTVLTHDGILICFSHLPQSRTDFRHQADFQHRTDFQHQHLDLQSRPSLTGVPVCQTIPSLFEKIPSPVS